MDFETLGYEVRDGAAILTLARPERRNAINGTMSLELPRVWDEIKRDPGVGVVVVTS